MDGLAAGVGRVEPRADASSRVPAPPIEGLNGNRPEVPPVVRLDWRLDVVEDGGPELGLDRALVPWAVPAAVVDGVLVPEEAEDRGALAGLDGEIAGDYKLH